MKIKMRKKTIISFALALAMVISFMPGNVLKVLADGENNVSVSINLYDETIGDWGEYVENDELFGTFVTANENVVKSKINIDAYWPTADGGVPDDGYDTIVEYNNFATFNSSDIQIYASGILTVPVPEGYVGTDAKFKDFGFGNYNNYFSIVSTSEKSVTLQLSDNYVLACEENADGFSQWEASTFYLNLKSEGSEPDTYTVTFYDGDKKLDEKTVEDGSKVTKPASDPTKDGYIFAGWYADKDLKTAFDFDKAIADNTNIYAKWTKNEEPTPEEPTPEEPTPEEPTPVEPTPATGTLASTGIYCAQDNPSIIAAYLTEKSVEADTIEYRWLACEESNPNAWFVVSDWTKSNYYLSWTPEKSGDYIIVAQARLVGNEEKTLVYDSFGVNFRTVNAKIKDICQMPYEGGYLIGIESTANPNQSLKYEMLVMDLSLYAAGNPNCWVHSVKGGVAEGNALWTIWEPQYGYYVTLFRIYDANDNLLDETAYGFANAY